MMICRFADDEVFAAISDHFDFVLVYWAYLLAVVAIVVEDLGAG